MLKLYHREIVLLQKILDTSVIILSWGLAYFTRFSTFHPEHSWYIKYAFLLTVFQYVFFRKLGLYESKRLRNTIFEMIETLRANLLVLGIFVLFVYFFSAEKISRAVLLNYGVYSTVFLLFEKSLIRMFLRRSRAKGRNLRHIVLVGDGKQTVDYLLALRNDPAIGIKIKGWIDSGGLNEKFAIEPLEFEKASQKGVDYLVIGYSMREFHKVDAILKQVSADLVNITVLPDVSYAVLGHEIAEFSGLPVININHSRLSSRSVITKRIFDFSVSLIGLIFISPLLLLISLAVKLSSPGPIFFGQRRVGLDGKEFKMWKFRSMKVDSEAKGSGWTVPNDPRKTKIGAILRQTSLDELPQLWNVFLGQMSLVGPRPEQPYYVEKFKEEIPTYMHRHKMKAGITGWAQVNGWRGDTSIHARIECDIWYIKNWSLWLDLEILLMTVWKGFKNAY